MNGQIEKLSGEFEIDGYPDNLRVLVERYAFDLLAKGRLDWDVPHTMAVVSWANKLARIQGLDVAVLTTAAYLHDIGYYGQFVGLESADLGRVMDKKKKHMMAGAIMAAEFLSSNEVRKFLTGEQIDRIIYLISVHDKVGELKYVDELVLMEADSLGAIDLTFVEPTYRGKEALYYLETRMIKRRKRFVTPEAMLAYDELAERFFAFIETRDFLPGEIARWDNEGGN